MVEFYNLEMESGTYAQMVKQGFEDPEFKVVLARSW